MPSKAQYVVVSTAVTYNETRVPLGIPRAEINSTFPHPRDVHGCSHGTPRRHKLWTWCKVSQGLKYLCSRLLVDIRKNFLLFYMVSFVFLVWFVESLSTNRKYFEILLAYAIHARTWRLTHSWLCYLPLHYKLYSIFFSFIGLLFNIWSF